MISLQERYLAAKRALFDKAYENLNEQQRKAVFTINRPLLILAGAGSGKTTVLVKRIAYIIQYGNAYATDHVPQGLSEERVADLEHAVNLSREEITPILSEFICDPCPPYRMLAITFTNKAAKEIKTRLSATFQNETDVQDIWSGTFHSICMRILRVHSERIGYGKQFTIYDTDDVKKTVASVMKRMGIDDKQFPLKSITNAISRAKDALQLPEDVAAEAGSNFRMEKIAAIYKEYQAELRRSNAMDFDDIIMQTVRLLETCPDVLQQYQRKFRYVCVDEYQDTNQAQFRLTHLLSGGERNLMVVGDDDQSIYKFRGATIQNILDFDKVYPDAVTIKLEQNYRSTQTILNAANHVIAHNMGRRGKQLWTAGMEGEKIYLQKVEDQVAESRFIVDTIHRKMAEARAVGRECSYRNFAVLYRTNSQSSSIERAMAKSAIPYRLVGGTRFNDRKEIRDAVAYLQLISNHADKERLLRIINEPRRKIGDKTLEAVQTIALEQDCSLFEVMVHAHDYMALARSAATLKQFADLIEGLTKDAETMSLTELFDAWMERSGYLDMLIAGGEAEKERIDNLYELKSNMLEYSNNAEEPSLVGFLEENALVAEVDKYDDKADAVALMTIHSAKGLEFPIVFLPGMEDGIFPGMQTILGNPEDMEEERRLAYVALTRAKEQVFILHTKSRLWYGQTVYNPKSRFVTEIPDELMAEEDATAGATMGTTTSRGYGFGGGGVASSQPKVYYSERPRHTSVPTDTITVGRPKPSSEQAAAARNNREQMKTLSPGDRVSHVTFGEGEILSAKPMGNDILFEVVFDKVGTKKLMGTYAKLKKL